MKIFSQFCSEFMFFSFSYKSNQILNLLATLTSLAADGFSGHLWARSTPSRSLYDLKAASQCTFI
jgi:hypothetical protein